MPRIKYDIDEDEDYLDEDQDWQDHTELPPWIIAAEIEEREELREQFGDIFS